MKEQDILDRQKISGDTRERWRGEQSLHRDQNKMPGSIFPTENRSAKLDEDAEWVKKYVEEFGEMPSFF